jgi:hypothetical protein
MSTQFTNRQWRLPNNENKDKQSNYSMDFDGSQKIILNSPIQLTTNKSISVWCYVEPTVNQNTLLGGDAFPIYYFWLDNPNSKIYIRDNTAITQLSTGTLSEGWTHFCITGDGTTATLYVNGVSTSTGTDRELDIRAIGGYVTGSSYFFNGKADGVSIFDYALSSSQVTTLYGSSSTGIGNPMTLNPVAFYNLGDKSAFNGADYLVPNIAAEEADGDIATSFSPYALDFDAASSDYINCGDSDDFSFGNGSTDSPFSISAWVNWRSISANNPPFVSKWGSSLKEWLFILNNDGKIRFYLIGGGNVQKISATTLSSNTWYHVTATYDGSGGSTAYNGMNLYINGVKENATNAGAAYNAMTNTSQPVEIGRYQANRYFDGKISNASIWNTELTSAQVTEIYNEGVPSNLNNHSAYSNLVSWWQLGSNSSFNTNWTVLDEKGSNNGTSVNMGEDAIVDGVGSYANGLSSGMGGDEVVGDAPYSTANSLSVNMDVEDRVTDTPS